jgi:hypothetical protein
MLGLPVRQRQSRFSARRQISRTASVPACTGGWNARDSLANMKPQDAVSLINWFPSPSDIGVRKGYSQWSTGYGAAVETLMLYEGNTLEQLFAASGTAFYNATSSGAVGAAVQSGLTNARWIWTNFTTTGGVRYLVAVNGTDSPRTWDGAAWVTVTGVSVPAITGITPTAINYITQHKSRLWVTIKNTMEVWYGPVGGFGAFNLLDLRPVFKMGGTITAIETWSLDGGYGLDDHLVCMSSNGEIAIYRGTDPSSATTWALIGLYYFSAPVGNKPLFKYGGDLLVLCQDGLFPLAQSLESSRVSTHSTLTDKIQDALGSKILETQSSYGWQITTNPLESALMLNVPQGSNVWEQYVMNTITGAWCRFQGWNSSCWVTWKERQFFGGATYVGKAFDTYADNGGQIVGDVKPAFNYFASRGVLKQWVMARPIISTDGSPGLAYGLNVDFEDNAVTGTPTLVTSTAGIWDSSVWDSGVWGGSLAINKGWQYLTGLGYCASFRIASATNGMQCRLSSIDYVYKLGGVL